MLRCLKVVLSTEMKKWFDSTMASKKAFYHSKVINYCNGRRGSRGSQHYLNKPACDDTGYGLHSYGNCQFQLMMMKLSLAEFFNSNLF